MDAPAAQRPPSRIGAALRRVGRLLLAIPTVMIVAAMAVMLAVQIIQDRTIWLALIFYLPLWPVGIAAIGWDVFRLGRALRLRWLMACLGVAFVIMGVSAMWGPVPPPETVPPGGQSVKLLQWNVRWGGTRQQDSLARMLDEVRRIDADICVISEAPPTEYLLHMWNRIAPPRHHATAGFGPGMTDYWFRIVVLSRWPVHVRENWRLPEGRAALFEIESPAGVLRLLAVDVESSLRVLRGPSLQRVGRILQELSDAGRAAHFVAGDFNAPARSHGFETINKAGYRRAALYSGQWRATWPSIFPVLDIDHILVRRDLPVTSATLFSNLGSDHRGQTACAVVPSAEIDAKK